MLQAERVAASFGLTVRAQPLGSQQDSNFLLVNGGRVLGVLKIANPAFSAAEIEAQDRAAARIAAACRDLRVATVTHGPITVPVDGGAALARVLRYLPGGTLAGAGRYLSPRVVAGLGAVAGQVSLALSSFEHPGLDRVLQWDLRHALRVVDALAGHVRDAGLRRRVTAAARAAWSRVEPLAGRLPWQAVHSDVTDDNVVCRVERGLRTPDGIIDFGDVTVTALVNDLGIAVANMLGDGPDPFGPGLDLIAGYHAVTPLTAAELSLLPDLILGRVVARIIISEWRAERFPENRAYVLRNTPRAREHLHRLLSIPGEQTAARIQEATRA